MQIPRSLRRDNKGKTQTRKTKEYLQRITNIDEKGGVIRRDRDPSSIPEAYLEARRVVGPQDRNYLRVGVLPEPNQVATARAKCLQLRARRVVIQPEERVARLAPQHATQHVPRLDPKPVGHQFQHSERHFLYCSHEILHRTSIFLCFCHQDKKKLID